MTPLHIRPIPKPSIGAQESFIEPLDKSFKQGMKKTVGKKQRYAQSDADLLLKTPKDDFEQLTVRCLVEDDETHSQDEGDSIQPSK